jgi:hypothetical protein
MNSKDIIFTNSLGIYNIFPPEPASINIPEWYKESESYVNNKKQPFIEDNTTSATIKKCMPVFDMISAGYIIKSQADVYVSKTLGENGFETHFQWSNFDLIEFHSVNQAKSHPYRKNIYMSYPKWINHWGIETPPGHSTLFIQPSHRDSIFTIMPGIVDTDKYISPVNFPFVLNDKDFEGLIPAGTPIAQAIPFKRHAYKMSFGNESNLLRQNNIKAQTRSRFFDSYKTLFRSKKEYK